MVQIAVIDASNHLTKEQIAPVMTALYVQITRDFQPFWNINAEFTSFNLTDKIPKDYWWLVLLDTPSQADSLGFGHLTEKHKNPAGKVYVEPYISRNVPWSLAASKVLLEMLVDPFCTLNATTSISSGSSIILTGKDVCSPVGESSYKINDTVVSNFVTPAWFNPHAKTGPFDFQNKIKSPLKIQKGGFVNKWSSDSKTWKLESNKADQFELDLFMVTRGGLRNLGGHGVETKLDKDHISRVIEANVRETDKEKTRSPKWPGVRNKHLKDFPNCAACGAIRGLQVHHIAPYHLNPEKELDPENLITLCEYLGGPECHLNIGHGGKWKKAVDDVVKFASEFRNNPDNRSQILEEVRTHAR